MNKKTAPVKPVLTLLMILALSLSLLSQTETINLKKTAPPASEKKADQKTEPGKETTPAKKDQPAGEKKPADEKKVADEKKPSDDKKTPPKEKPKEVMDDKQKGEKITQTLDYGIQKDRMIAINMISDIKDEQIKKSLLQKVAALATTDADMEIRKAAVTAIGDHKSTENSQAVINALDDSIDDVKIAACYSIGKMKLAEAKPKLVETLKKQDLANPSNFTDALVIALGDLNAPEVIDFALEGIKNQKNSKMVRERLLLFIGKCGSAAQKDFLLEIYKDDQEDMTLRSYAVKDIAKLKIKEAAPAIKEVIAEIDSYSFNKKKKYYDLYMQSVASLVELGDADSIPLLMNSIRSDNANVRYRAVILIKEFNDERTIDILKYKMKYDPSDRVRKAAQKALEEKGVIEKGKNSENIPESSEKNEDAE